MITHWQCKKFYTIIQSQSTVYGKFVDFYDNYFKSHINGELQLDDNVKVFYIGCAWPLNSFIF